MSKSFFTTKDNFKHIIQSSFENEKVITLNHIKTGWTNIVIEVETDQNTYFFRFPRNPFWAKMIVKDTIFCQFIEGKTSFYTPHMTLLYHENRPFSKHVKIAGYCLADRVYHLSHTASAAVASDILLFLKELSNIPLNKVPKNAKYPLSKFLKELDDLHYKTHITADHEYIKSSEKLKKTLVHGDLNLSNILLDKNDKMVAVIDFCFAGTGHPHMDTSRILSRPSPENFETSLKSNFNKSQLKTIERMQQAWQHIDAGYADHIRTHFPEIDL
jgi:aminoglycoside phosphotransferase (APT) family kinase protein